MLYAVFFFSSQTQRDQMIAAQEMFRQSNKVTRPEKALILGFMAGARGKNQCCLIHSFKEEEANV